MSFPSTSNLQSTPQSHIVKVKYNLYLGMIKSYFFYLFISYTLYPALSGRQREPSIETLGSQLSAELWSYCVLSGRPHRRALPPHQSEEMEI